MSNENFNAIEFENVWFRYEDDEDYILKGISFTIRQGELVAVVGPNGAGKTTLIKHINGLLKPSKGSVRIYGMDTKKKSVAELSRIAGLIFQNPHHQLFAETVLKEVLFGIENFNLPNPRGKAVEVLRMFSLLKYAERSPLSLSGGEKKRLCIASVIAWDPKIIVLDEPTVGQDLVNKQKLLGLIANWTRLGKTIIVVTHDIEFLWRLSPRVLVLVDGTLALDAPAIRVFREVNILEKLRLRQPQLAELAEKMGLKETPISPSELVQKILGG